jgi:hypothetical protein
MILKSRFGLTVRTTALSTEWTSAVGMIYRSNWRLKVERFFGNMFAVIISGFLPFAGMAILHVSYVEAGIAVIIMHGAILLEELRSRT